jgi:hypothetical protein
LHLLFRLNPGLGSIWVEQRAQAGILGRELVVLSHQERHLVLGKANLCPSIISSWSRIWTGSRQRRVAAVSSLMVGS